MPTMQAVADAINAAAARGGNVVIPAFAVDRTELLLLMLQRLMGEQRIPTLPVFADSPMALSVLDVYRAELDDSIDFDPGGGLHECRSVEQSMAIADHVGPAIIISASGMATGGRVLHHLARLLPDPRNAVILCGFQAAGTRGRSLADGARQIRMHGRDIPVRASVTQLTSMSVHADADALVAWVDDLPSDPTTSTSSTASPRPVPRFRFGSEPNSVVDATVPAQFDEVDARRARRTPTSAGAHRTGRKADHERLVIRPVRRPAPARPGRDRDRGARGERHRMSTHIEHCVAGESDEEHELALVREHRRRRFGPALPPRPHPPTRSVASPMPVSRTDNDASIHGRRRGVRAAM